MNRAVPISGIEFSRNVSSSIPQSFGQGMIWELVVAVGYAASRRYLLLLNNSGTPFAHV
jgi:hypothetical protein